MRATMPSAESDSGDGVAHNRISRQSTPLDLILIVDVDSASGVLEVADALVFVEVQQQEVTVEPVMNGDGDRNHWFAVAYMQAIAAGPAQPTIPVTRCRTGKQRSGYCNDPGFPMASCIGPSAGETTPEGPWLCEVKVMTLRPRPLSKLFYRMDACVWGHGVSSEAVVAVVDRALPRRFCRTRH